MNGTNAFHAWNVEDLPDIDLMVLESWDGMSKGGSNG